MKSCNSDAKVEVSVICTTFNQVGYLEQCLNSLVSQETSFNYEIIVHDDASTDGTQQIIQAFVEKYPNLITPVIQDDNLFSRGLSNVAYILPLIKGDYVAICEGDDYWLSPKKLQRQYDYMVSHPDCSLCLHAVLEYDDEIKAYSRTRRLDTVERDVSFDEIMNQWAEKCGTNSIFRKAKHYDRPDVFKGWGVGDYPLVIFLASQGTVHFLPETMSCYRLNAKGSWTVRNRDKEIHINSCRNIIKGLHKADEYE